MATIPEISQLIVEETLEWQKPTIRDIVCGAEHQVIICVYHAVPLVDWNLTGQNPQLTVSSISDFPQPAFDQLGMQPVPGLNLHNNPSRSVPSSIGYNLRYWQWKSSIDTVHDRFPFWSGLPVLVRSS